VTAQLAQLLLDTLQLRPEPTRGDLAARWSRLQATGRAAAIATWLGWEGGEQWLLRRLADGGALSAAPPGLVQALRRAARDDAKAGMAIDAEAVLVLRVLSELDVPCVLLKGPARRAGAPSLALADARRTHDVDLLVPEVDVERAWRALLARGYAPTVRYTQASAPPEESELWGPSPYHPRPLLRPGGAAVELHVTTGSGLAPIEAWNRITSTAQEVQWQGLPARVPSPTELLWHALTHADVCQSFAWRLRHWLDAASVLAAQPVDWSAIHSRLGSPELPHRASALRWLSMASRLAGIALPPEMATQERLPLERLVEWRLAVFARHAAGAQWTEKLIDEGTRVAVGLGLAPLVAGRSWPIHVRRRSASLLARGRYCLWRVVRR